MPDNLVFYRETEFKDTEIGRIPKEWEVKKLKETAIDIYYGITAKAVERPAELRMLRTTDINNYNVNWDNLPYCMITEKRNNISRFLLEKDDLIIARAGTIGVSILVEKNLKDVIFGSYLIKVKLNNNVNPKFVHFLFQSNIYWNQITLSQAGSTLKNINLPIITSLKIPLPPIEEQQQIASILSTIDEAIQKTDEVIAKTERLKKGMMQELLTKGIGHKEFKDTEIGRIPKEWKLATLKDVATVSSGNTAPQEDRYFKDGKFPFVRVQHLSELEEQRFPVQCDLVNETAISELKLKLFKKGSIIFPKSGESIRLERRAMLKENSFVVNHLAVIEPISQEVLNLFLFYYLCTVKTSNYLTKTTMPSLNLYTIQTFYIPIPSLPEQQQITSILVTLDEKLELARKQKTKLERIKQGFMNELLTGRIRVGVRS
ncbi:MAG: restriction endonuclease subunit S [Caldisericum sp.]